MSCKLYLKDKSKVVLPNGNDSILFNKILGIVGSYQKALDIYEVTETSEFKEYNKGYIAQYRADRSVVKNATPSSVRGFNEVFNEDNTVKIVYSETSNKVSLELIESRDLGKGKARKFLQDFIYSFPNKDIELIISPRDRGTTYQGLAKFYESLGFQYKDHSDIEMIRYKNRGRLYPEGYDANFEPSVSVLTNYINDRSENKASKREVMDFMKAKGVTDTDSLIKELSKLYNNGIPIYTKENLKRISLLNSYDIYRLQKEEGARTELEGIYNYLRTSDYIEISETDVVPSGGMIGALTPSVKDTDINSEVSVVIDGEVVSTKGNNLNVDMSTTINDNANPVLAEDIAFLRSISEDTWYNDVDNVVTILESIEESAKENGVNLVGLSQTATEVSRESIMNLLNVVEDGIESNNSAEIQPLVDTLIGQDYKQAPFELKEGEYYFKFPVNEQTAFEEMSLIKVTDNLYRRVAKVSTPELLANIANMTQQPLSKIEQMANLNKDKSIEDADIAEQIYLQKVANGVNEFVLEHDVDSISSTSVSDYYRENFEKDFAQWLINNDNESFTVDSNGIRFTNPYNQVEAFNRLPKYMRDSLVEYSKISNSINIPFVNKSPTVENGDIFVDRSKVIANINSVRTYRGDYTTHGEYIVVRNSVDNFLRIKETVYELVSESGNVGFYRELAPAPSRFADNVAIKPEATSSILGLNILKDIARPLEVAENLTQEELEQINEQHFEC